MTESVCVRTSKSLGWNMFLMMTTFSCLFLTSPCFSGLQSSCLHRQIHKQGAFTQRMGEKRLASQIHVWVISMCDGSLMQSGNVQFNIM